MKEQVQNTVPALLSLLGGVLILSNILLIGINSSPIVVSNSAPDSVESLFKESAPFWGRIAFGTLSYAEGFGPAIGVFLASIIIYCSLILYFKPRLENVLSSIIIILSATALLYGGGFIIGSILAFLGGALAFQKHKKFGETFIGKILLALKADSKLFQYFTTQNAIRDAAIAIVFVNLLSGIGNGLYGFNVEKMGVQIYTPTPVNANITFNPTSAAYATDIASQVLLNGRVFGDISIASTPIMLMGLGIIKWIILSLLLFLVAVKFFGEEADISSIAACTGFAYAPISLQLFTPFVFTSIPYLASTWPMTVFFITNIWMFLILTIGLKHVLNIPLTRSLATLTLCGAIYVLINYFIFMPLQIPHLWKFQIQPQEAMVFMASFLIAVSVFFMGKKRS